MPETCFGASPRPSYARPAARSQPTSIWRWVYSPSPALDTAAAADSVHVVDGPFTGDTTAAVATARWWLDEARARSESLQQAMGNAQIALSGLANR